MFSCRSFLKGKKQQEELIAVCVSLGLAILKGFAALWTGSLSLLASAFDSFLDFCISSVNLFALTVSHRPPDSEHAFGHGKAEALGGLFQSFVLILTAGFLVYSSIQRLRQPFELSHLGAGMGVIAFSLLVSLWLGLRLRRSARRTGSIVLKSDAVHYMVDLYSYGAILIAFLLIQFTGLKFWDPLITIPIAFYLALQGSGIGKEAINELMDKEDSPEILERVQEILSRHASIRGMHNFKSRRVAGKRFIQFHMEMKRSLSFEQAHEITELIVEEIQDTWEDAQVIIHSDPEGHGQDASDLQ